MYRNALQIGFVASALVVFSGCHAMHQYRYQPLDHHHGWDPVLGSCDMCGVCGGDCVGHTPSSYTKHMLTCASGCGEIYWGEWLSDPPDACDPCDNHGNWIGPQPCCAPTFLQQLAIGWHSLWGYRCSGYGDEMPLVEYHVPLTEAIEVPQAPAETEFQGIEDAAGDDNLAPPASAPEREPTLRSTSRPPWRARTISFPSRRFSR